MDLQNFIAKPKKKRRSSQSDNIIGKIQQKKDDKGKFDQIFKDLGLLIKGNQVEKKQNPRKGNEIQFINLEEEITENKYTRKQKKKSQIIKIKNIIQDDG